MVPLSPPRSEMAKTASPQRGNDINRSTSPHRGSEASQGTIPQNVYPQRGRVNEAPRRSYPTGSSSRRGSEVPQGTANFQKGSEAAQRLSSPRGLMPTSSSPSSRRESEVSQISSFQQPNDPAQKIPPQKGNNATRSASPYKGMEVPPNVSPRRVSDFSQSTSSRRGSQFNPNASPQRETNLPQQGKAPVRTVSPQTVMESRRKSSIHPGQVKMTASRMLIAMKHSLNSQREEMCQRLRSASNAEKSEMENKYMPFIPVWNDSLPPIPRYFEKPANNLKDAWTQTSKMTSQLVTEQGQQYTSRTPKKLIRKQVPNPKDKCIQTETIYQDPFFSKKETPQLEMWTRTTQTPLPGAEARSKACPVPTVIVSSYSEIKPNCKCAFDAERGSDYMRPFYQEMDTVRKHSLSPRSELLHRTSLSTEAEKRKNSLLTWTEPVCQHAVPTELDVRRNLQTRQELTQETKRPVIHPETESEYRCQLHQEMEAKDFKPVLSLGDELLSWIPVSTSNTNLKEHYPIHKSSLQQKKEVRRYQEKKAVPYSSHQEPLWSESLPSDQNALLRKPAFHPESESEYRCKLHQQLEATQKQFFAQGAELLPQRNLLTSRPEATPKVKPAFHPENLDTTWLAAVNIDKELKCSLQPDAETNIRDLPHTEVARTCGILPPRCLEKFGPQSPWWSLLQVDTSPLFPQSKKRTSQPAPDWMETYRSFSVPEPREHCTAHLAPDWRERHFSGPAQEHLLDKPTMESEAVSDFPCDCVTVPRKKQAVMTMRSEKPPTSLASQRRGQGPERAIYNSEADDLLKLQRGKSVARFSAFFVGMLSKFKLCLPSCPRGSRKPCCSPEQAFMVPL